MKRRTFLKNVCLAATANEWIGSLRGAETNNSFSSHSFSLDPSLRADWLKRWEQHVLGEAHHRYCDSEMGEELGWLMSPFLNGFYYGYLATHDAKWVEQLVDWADAWIKRGLTEPDGLVGWPKGGTGGAVEKELYTDSLLGEAMAFRPVVLMAGEILKNPDLKERFGAKADGYLKLAGKTFEKWVARGCWRDIREGGVWVVPEFGIDQKTGKWTDGYSNRNINGFTNPANKQNHIARWLIAMYDVTGRRACLDHAEKWWRVMKSRMKTREEGKYFVWNYWDPAGRWDYNPDGSTRHWVGVHPNGGYYQIDLEGIVTAFEHGLVFSKDDIERLIATNRDFMWNHEMTKARFQRIDGGTVDPRWKDSPGTLWTALVPYDETLRKIFIANNNTASWGGLASIPRFLAYSK